ncbi:MAG: PQQ-binding-like beta-propeller repeat protein [Saprospiraceae bacterium]
MMTPQQVFSTAKRFAFTSRQKKLSLLYFQLILFALLLCPACQSNDPKLADANWPLYSADATGSKYSPLQQINTSNVSQLQLAWILETGDMRLSPATTIECNPIMIDSVVYLTSPGLKVLAVNGATGKEIWRFDPYEGNSASGVNRGVTYWSNGTEQRLFYVAGSTLYALDAKDGNLVTAFGQAGKVDLYQGLGRSVEAMWVTAATPGIIYKDLLIMGTTLGEGPSPAAPGHIRAYDVQTGEMRWIFRTIPSPGEAGYETWPADAWQRIGGANAWGGFTLDEKRGMVFCGTGSAAYDHWGGNRLGANLFANCILALQAETGERVWHYQVVHHDIWDYDIPCPPNLVQVKKDGQLIDAIAQPTKMGHLFVLNRETGEPIFPIEELPVPQSDIPGEESWPTQPFPPAALRYAKQRFTVDEVSDRSPEIADAITARLKEMRTGDIFLPPGLQAAVTLPQFNGGTDWGGAAYDPRTRTLFVNCSNEAEWISMVKAEPAREISQFQLGQGLYRSLCSACHGFGVPRNPGSPSLDQLKITIKEKPIGHVQTTLQNGKGQMPKFAMLSNDEQNALAAFLREEGKDQIFKREDLQLSFSEEIPYIATGHNEFKDPEGFPVNQPPWGVLSAIDMDKGGIKWQATLGTYPELEAKGLPPTGTFNMGGPVSTAGGLIFIGATMDERFRAFDAADGKVLWEYQLDAGAYATPATYAINGKQYVLIAAGGGGKPGTRPGGKYYCFALP